jgi:LmbE family N-acetylglucosaminyl deacetylase
MKKVIFGIFAHPDDEAFGPAGTLVMEKKAGSEIHLICATAGEAGMNPDAVSDLAKTRSEEWRKAGQLIGADSMHQLGYADGGLHNSQFHEIAAKIDEIVRSVAADRQDIEIEFMSLDLNGLTGHLDHILIARVACYVFYKLKATDARVMRIRLACTTREEFPVPNCDWIYMEAGRTLEEINETVNANEHLALINEIIHAHHSQRSDAAAYIRRLGDAVAINHFIVLR